MEAIAAASTAQKQAIRRHFRTSQLFAEAFDSTVATPTMLSALDSFGKDQIASALRHLLEAFYEIALYEGLPIDAEDNTGRHFDRRQFVEVCQRENYGRVCPFCDGDMNGPQVDHWLPKSKYPALSCHPKNLVPICYRCNALEKGEKIPLDAANPRPFDNWFHPYERPAHGNFTLSVNGSRVSLTNVDPVQQSRLNNFDQLVKLTQRWWEEYRSQKRNYLNQLKGRIQKGKSKPTAEDVLETVQSWLEDIAAERTLMPHSIIRRVVLARVNTTESPDFEGWLKHAEDALR